LLLAAGCAATDATPRRARPSVLLLVVDCLRADHVGAYGYPRPTTPTIDTIAGAGTLFSQAFSQASWTRPSVPTLLTGLYPSEHGLTSFGNDRDDAIGGRKLASEIITVPEALKTAGYATALIGEQYQLSPRFGLDQGFDFYRYRTAGSARTHKLFFEWIDGLGGQPFFSYLHYLEIHWPYCPKSRTRDVFSDGDSDIDLCRDWRKLRDDILDGRRTLSAADQRAMVARYDEEMLGLDIRLADLKNDLAERGLWDELMVIVTSDHGEEFFERGTMGHGQSLHEELIHVPLIIKPPASWRWPRGQKTDALAEVRDIAATILDAAGVELTALRGPSLLPWASPAAPSIPPHEFIVSEGHRTVATRTVDWKLIVDVTEQTEQLYDLREDPGETTDLSDRRPEDLQRMRELVADWRAGLVSITGSAAEALDPELEEGLRALGYLDD